MTRTLDWLVPTARDRERFFDMQARIGPARVITVICGLLVMASLLPDAGWAVVPLALAMIVIALLGAVRLEKRRHPELWVFVSTVLNVQVVVAVAALLVGGQTSIACLLVAPVVMVAVRFSVRGLAVGAPVSGLLIVLVAVLPDPHRVVAHPATLVVPLCMLILVTAYLHALVASDVRHRADSQVDALTGLLNRRALSSRLAELGAQARLNGEPVSVIAIDVDQFKELNDSAGHAHGDEVLRRVASALRGSLRSFDLLYRIGGDEFLLLVPGAGALDAMRLAHQLRAAVRESAVEVTCSFGVATLGPENEDLQDVAEEADRALYRAKRAGRNRVISRDIGLMLADADADGPPMSGSGRVEAGSASIAWDH